MHFMKQFVLTYLIAALSCHCSGANPKCEPGTFLSRNKCELCPTGTYQNKKGTSSCIPCPVGYINPFKGAPGIDICQRCKPRTFSPMEGASSCKPCPKGMSSPAGSDRCISCPKGSFISKCPQQFDEPVEADVNGICFVYLNGITTRSRAELKCRKCEPFSFSTKPNALTCNLCPDNLTAEEGSSKCKTCPPGYGDENQTGICQKCRYWFYNDGSTYFCLQCHSGFQGNVKNGAESCVPCPAGTGGMEGCDVCKPGENSFVTGATFCMPDNTPCASNFFRSAGGACLKCSKIQRYNKRKKTCESCKGDEVIGGGLSEKCSKCPPGEEASVIISAESSVNYEGRSCVCKQGLMRMPDGKCRPCPAGWSRDGYYGFGDESGGAACRMCFEGTFGRKPGMKKCLPCPPGTIQPLRGETKCVKCPAGLIAVNDECVDPVTRCKKGKKRVNTGRRFSCEPIDDFGLLPCSIHERYNPKTKYCQACPSESVSKGGISTTCEKCKDDAIVWTSECTCVGGHGFGREIRNGKCQKCPQGTIGRTGVPGCKICPAGTFYLERLGGFPMECDLCKAGTFSNAGASRCSKCPKGTVSFGVGDANCVKLGSLK